MSMRMNEVIIISAAGSRLSAVMNSRTWMVTE